MSLKIGDSYNTLTSTNNIYYYDISNDTKLSTADITITNTLGKEYKTSVSWKKDTQYPTMLINLVEMNYITKDNLSSDKTTLIPNIELKDEKQSLSLTSEDDAGNTINKILVYNYDYINNYPREIIKIYSTNAANLSIVQNDMPSGNRVNIESSGKTSSSTWYYAIHPDDTDYVKNENKNNNSTNKSEENPYPDNPSYTLKSSKSISNVIQLIYNDANSSKYTNKKTLVNNLSYDDNKMLVNNPSYVDNETFSTDTSASGRKVCYIADNETSYASKICYTAKVDMNRPTCPSIAADNNTYTINSIIDTSLSSNNGYNDMNLQRWTLNCYNNETKSWRTADNISSDRKTFTCKSKEIMQVNMWDHGGNIIYCN